MKAEELRIGNFVYMDIMTEEVKIEKRVYAVNYLMIRDAIEYGDGWTGSPIPLTPEWLTKFGFNSKYKSVHMHWNLGPFDLEQKSDVDDDNNFIPQENIWYFGYSGWVVDVVWVHQLQNLYFALTGKELTINA